MSSRCALSHKLFFSWSAFFTASLHGSAGREGADVPVPEAPEAPDMQDMRGPNVSCGFWRPVSPAGEGCGRDSLAGDMLDRDSLEGDGCGRVSLEGDGCGRESLEGDGCGRDSLEDEAAVILWKAMGVADSLWERTQ